MEIPAALRKQLEQTLKIRNSAVPLHRVIDVLATENGDIAEAMKRYRDLKPEDLRRALHNCAELLRTLETEAGLTAAWDAATRKASAPQSAGDKEPASPPKSTKARFTPDELKPFEDDELRGKVRVAKAYVDGASKGNPGPSGIGIALLTMEGKKIAQAARAIGIGTNNNAEYTALIDALQLAHRMGVRVLNVISDSQLMVSQMTGKYKIKNAEILKKVREAHGLVKQFERFTISYVGREQNTLADALSTSVLKKEKAGAAASTVEGEEGTVPDDLLPPLETDPDEGATE